jgi:hypothetical protein
MIHVYAFAERLRALPAVEGVDGAALEMVTTDDVAAVFSRRQRQTTNDTLQADALTHGTVVDALRDSAVVVVPVRFGEELLDDAALKKAVGEQAGTIRRTFDRVRDCDEVGVRVWDRPLGPARPAASGAAYLHERRAAERRRRETVEQLHRQLSTIAREARVTESFTLERELLSAAYLVPSSRLRELRATVGGFIDAQPELTVVCTGPWAPFSFTGGERAQ